MERPTEDDRGVDDGGYIRVLRAILTNPEPTGIDPDDPYGQADDGIDRYDGFGRDVLVDSLDVVDGNHGAELVVTFALALPPDPSSEQIPAQGVVHLPFDQEWRRLGGYSDPAGYAPEVAARVMSAAHDHVARHRGGQDWLDARDRARAFLPGRDAQWQMLLDALNAEGHAVEVSAGRFELVIVDDEEDERVDVVTVVVTPDEWEDVLATRAGREPDLYIAELLGPRDDDERFVVFYDGDLVRSTREHLPPVRGRAFDRKVIESQATRPDAEVGWTGHRVGEAHDLEPPS